MNTIEEGSPSTKPSSPKLGIASIVLGILGIALYVLPFVAGYIAGSIAGATGTSHPVDRMDPVNIAGWVVSLCGNFLAFVALILGALSVAKENKKVFGVVGLLLGLLMTCGCLATIAYNLSQA